MSCSAVIAEASHPAEESALGAGLLNEVVNLNAVAPNRSIGRHNGEPIVPVHYSLRNGFDSPRSIADALNSSAHKDPLHDNWSYSVFNVHPWATIGRNIRVVDFVKCVATDPQCG